MTTIRLNVEKNVLQKVMKLLNSFSSKEQVIIQEDELFKKNQSYLQKELDEIDGGKSEFVSHEDLENSLNEVILKYENNLEEIVPT